LRKKPYYPYEDFRKLSLREVRRRVRNVALNHVIYGRAVWDIMVPDPPTAPDRLPDIT
jgi:hypothetical protein